MEAVYDPNLKSRSSRPLPLQSIEATGGSYPLLSTKWRRRQRAGGETGRPPLCRLPPSFSARYQTVGIKPRSLPPSPFLACLCTPACRLSACGSLAIQSPPPPSDGRTDGWPTWGSSAAGEAASKKERAKMIIILSILLPLSVRPSMISRGASPRSR